MKDRLINVAKFLIGWPLSLVALYFIVKTFSTKTDQLLALNHVNYFLFGLALICFVSYYLFRSFIWLKLLHFLGHDIPFRESAFLWFSAQIKRYIPGNVWSFVGLAVSYQEKNVTKKDLAYGVLVESELVVIVTFVLSLLALPFVLTHFVTLPLSSGLVEWGLTVLFLLGTIVYIFSGKLIGERQGKLFTVLRHTFPRYTATQNLYLLCLMIGAYVLYGLGYYFSIASVVPLDPADFLTLIGIFIFSLVAGYLSVITPTGLGVREGVIAFGLSKFMSLSVAGFAAIFSRIIIVLAEVITLFLSYLWFRSGKKFQPQEKWVAAHMHEILLWVFMGIYSLYFTIISFLRYMNYYTGRFDLGNMTQTVWNTMHGRLFLLTDPNGTQTVSRLAFHADFILILLTPFYLLWSDPRIVLLIQVLVIAAGAYFIYRIAELILKNKTIALIFAFSYLMNPSVQRATIYDFHAVVLATTFLIAAVYFLVKKRLVWFLVFAILAALTKEELWFIIALFGPILFYFYKKRIFGTVIFLACLSIFYYLIWIAIPHAAHGSGHFALSYFRNGGNDPSDLIKHIMLSPGETFGTVAKADRFFYYNQLLLPIGFLPVTFPFWLIMAAPDLVINVLSDKRELQQIYYQYTATISSFLFLSAIYGVYYLRKGIKKIPLAFYSGYLLIFTFWGAYLFGPLPGAIEPNLDMLNKPQPERQALDRVLAAIPERASVSASNNLGSHLSNRQNIYVVPEGSTIADFVVIYKRFSNTNNKDAETLAAVKKDPHYLRTFENGQIVLFKRR